MGKAMKSDTNKSFLMSADYTCTAVPFNDGMAFHVQAQRRTSTSTKFIGVAWLDQHDQLDGDKVRDAFQDAWINAVLQVRIHVERVIAAFQEYQAKSRVMYYESIPKIVVDPVSFMRTPYATSMAINKPQTTPTYYGKPDWLMGDGYHMIPRQSEEADKIRKLVDTRTTYTYVLLPLYYLRFGRDYCGSVKALRRVDARGEIKALLRRCGHVLDRLPKEIVIEEDPKGKYATERHKTKEGMKYQPGRYPFIAGEGFFSDHT